MKRVLFKISILLFYFYSYCNIIGNFVIVKAAEEAEDLIEYSDIIKTNNTHTVYGTELLLLENSAYSSSDHDHHQSYKFEDFFWTGSESDDADGGTDNEENLWISSSTSEGSTFYKTSTIFTTVFIDSTNTEQPPLSGKEEPDNNGIEPTPTRSTLSANGSNNNDTDQQFWLLTVLKSDGKDPIIIDLKNSLAKLYKTAFQRQQAKHLGIIRAARLKRSPISDGNNNNKSVNVYIHQLNKEICNGEDENIKVLYHVEVQGKPVDAFTAAGDMKLISDDEVVTELGFPFVIKAEPYVKASSEPQGLARAKNTWLVIGGSMIAILIGLLIFAFLLLGFTKRKNSNRNNSDLAIENKRHIFERGVEEHDNKGFINDEINSSLTTRRKLNNSPTYINFEATHQHHNNVENPIIVHHHHHHKKTSFIRPSSTSTSSSASSNSSFLDISPLMNLSGKKRLNNINKSRPRGAALNKTVPLNNNDTATITRRKFRKEIFDSDGSSSRKDEEEEESPDLEGNFDRADGIMMMSPKSFLSMPSVKSFPRSQMPEPLHRVLEPVSVTNLDMPSSSSSEKRENLHLFRRHGSCGTMEDPGVIGPVVWNMHKERLKHGISMDDGIDGTINNNNNNVSRMRRRFHDLLDDTFSLFGSSRRDLDTEIISADNRSDAVSLQIRPKTTGAKPPPAASSSCRSAWSSSVASSSTFIRPFSAAPRIVYSSHSRAQTAPGDSGKGILKLPKGHVDQITGKSQIPPSDSATVVIDAIKNELEKVNNYSLPGSSSELNTNNK